MEREDHLLIALLMVASSASPSCGQSRHAFQQTASTSWSSESFNVNDSCSYCVLDTALVLDWNKQQPGGLYMTIDSNAVNLTAIMVEGLPNGLILCSGRSAEGGYMLLDVAGEFVRRMVLVYKKQSSKSVSYSIIEVPQYVRNGMDLRSLDPPE